uniref:Uncharacterized protein K02A2.6-like n=1 Tax=Crassostrea virginica TaxID=6565 RepID=A0A8B8CLE7_CRAVI|nr:uncharacterized protein K02A2.6-like [Crassostrea virginica]
MPTPQDKEGVRRFLGLIQYLSKFIPNLSDLDASLRILLKSDVEFQWNHEQEKGFQRLKEACTKPPVFALYNVNKPVEIECDSTPMRIQKMMIKLQWYDITVKYRKGTTMYISDALSRAYLEESEEEESDKADMICMLSITPEKYSEIHRATQKELETLMSTIQTGWPDTKNDSPFEVRQYFDSRDQLSVLDSIVYKGCRIVIPPSLRKTMLNLIHKSHLGIVKSKSRAREVMYWPAMNADIEQAVNNCSICAEYQKQQTREPVLPTTTPGLPYSHVGTEVFDYEGKKYLILVDYYSKYIDAVELKAETTIAIIEAMKTVFACHGLPGTLRSDNGPQFSSATFKIFCSDNGIEHERSSPHFQSSNGEAERVVQTVKCLWRKCEDKQFALIDYRTTPLDYINLSPAQLLMGRRPRNTLPASEDLLKPTTPDLRKVKQHFNAQKAKQKFYYDRRRGVKELLPLENGTTVRMETPGSKSLSSGIVVQKANKPRSYLVKIKGRLYRRNRVHLHKSNETVQDEQELPMEESSLD